MKSVKIAILAGSLSLLAWSQGMPQNNAGAAQQPTQQPATQANAAPQGSGSAGASTVSGCMQESWGRFLINTGTTTYDVKGSGTSLYNHINHMVQVRGLQDTKSAQGNVMPLYALQVQDTGQGCGPNAGMNAQNTAPAGTTGTAATGQPMTGAQQTQTPGMTPQTETAPQGATGTSTPSQSGTGEATETQPGGSSEPTAQPNGGMESKGTPAAGTPSSAVAAPAGSASSEATPEASESAAPAPTSTSRQPMETFNGCLSGSGNSFEFKSNGKTYRLQGNTIMLHGMSGHNVEITGEDFNGKAIQVNGARDLGSSCSKK